MINPPALFLEDPKANPPLGLLYVASALEQAGHKVRVLDYADKSASLWDFPEAEVYGVGFTTSQYRVARRFSYVLKAQHPNSWLIAGGPHVTLSLIHISEPTRPY